MRSLTKSERRLILILGTIAFLLLNFWGYNELTTRRTVAIAQQRTLRSEILRLKQLQTEKANAEINREWIASRLPAYKDIDQLETYLYNVVQVRAADLSIELTKEAPAATKKDDFVHRSIVVVEFTDEIEPLIKFLHEIQDREAFRFISHLELVAGKDPQKVRCQATIEQWWRPDSELLQDSLSAVPASSPAAAGPGAAGQPVPSASQPVISEPTGAASEVERSAVEAVKTAVSQIPPAPPQ
jgi:hypothetical protein